MREECQVMLGGIYGRPAVDRVPDPASEDGWFHLCAEHYDMLTRQYDKP
jgi:hypothetical protein